ncbi:family 1 glycosylhydrolase [Peribacillus sp. FSL K6-5616]|uniref:family 1 glycosylhydrolase n=1 Tax=Peribacillus sp. FSL K6-5616 TaxID=2921508 RepID=UPI00202CFCF4|nr:MULTISPECIES: family 1 glycosylhydrolase [Bacillaceae]
MHLIETYGDWRNRRRLLEFYERLCRTLTRYKGLVSYWLTFNEINIILLFFINTQ